jgi:hypothetical protein
MVPEVNVFGHIFSENGIRPDDAKIKAVSQAPPPKSFSEIRSFLGLTNYCSRYIPNYSTITFLKFRDERYRRAKSSNKPFTSQCGKFNTSYTANKLNKCPKKRFTTVFTLRSDRRPLYCWAKMEEMGKAIRKFN